MLRRRKRAEDKAEARDELLVRLIKEGYLKIRLTETSKELLAADPTTMDDYVYWCVHINARQAQALVEGRSVTRAALGGPQTDEEREAMRLLVLGPDA